MVQFDASHEYQLEELKFYLPKDFRNTIPFLLITDAEQNVSVCKLELTESVFSHNVYSVSLQNIISTNAGKVQLTLLFILDNGTITTASADNILLSYNNFNIAQAMQLIENLSEDIANKYFLIEEMTKLNIEMYQSIEERS